MENPNFTYQEKPIVPHEFLHCKCCHGIFVDILRMAKYETYGPSLSARAIKIRSIAPVSTRPSYVLQQHLTPVIKEWIVSRKRRCSSLSMRRVVRQLRWTWVTYLGTSLIFRMVVETKNCCPKFSAAILDFGPPSWILSLENNNLPLLETIKSNISRNTSFYRFPCKTNPMVVLFWWSDAS